MACHLYKTVRDVPLSSKKIVAAVNIVLKAIKIPHADVSVHIIGDYRMKTLNTTYRGKATTTDVLSFPTEDPTHDDIGDIFISAAQIRRQAPRFDVSEKEEFLRMLVHGILHLVGYDHIKKKDANMMFPLQERLLSSLIKKGL